MSRGLTRAAAWRPLLAGIDAVVNCVGVLQDGARDDMRRVHVEGDLRAVRSLRAGRRPPRRACLRARRRADGPTAFSRTKAEAEAHLAHARSRLGDPASRPGARAGGLWRHRDAARACRPCRSSRR